MSQIAAHPPGTFCWVELATTDVEAAASFYMDLFGWQLNKVPMGPESYYYMFQKEGQDVAAAFETSSAEQERGIPPHWQAYFAVDKIDEDVEEVVRLGGSVVEGPFDVYDSGRMALVQEPSGAFFSLWQAGKHIGVQRVHEHGAIAWVELASRNFAASEQFLAALFGWESETMTISDQPYTTFKLGDRYTGGMMPVRAEWGEMPAHWLVYFQVDDCDGIAARATAKGATVVNAPVMASGVGRFAVIADAQGAAFGILQPAR